MAGQLTVDTYIIKRLSRAGVDALQPTYQVTDLFIQVILPHIAVDLHRPLFEILSRHGIRLLVLQQLQNERNTSLTTVLPQQGRKDFEERKHPHAQEAQSGGRCVGMGAKQARYGT